MVFGDLADEQQRGENDADLDGDRQVGEDGQGEGGEPDADGRPTTASGASGSPAIRPCCRRPPSGSPTRTASGISWASGAANEQDGEQREGMNHPGDRRLAPERMFVAVRAMAPVAGMPPKNGESDVGDPLRHQFHVGVVLVAAHPVGDHGRHQRLDGAQQGDGQGRGDQGRRSCRSRNAARRKRAGRWGCRRTECRWFRPADASDVPRRSVPSEQGDDGAGNAS